MPMGIYEGHWEVDLAHMYPPSPGREGNPVRQEPG